jgi:ADP-ribosylglycohydrolase
MLTSMDLIPPPDAALDRALGALFGLALGDALGMPTQELTRARAEQLLESGPALLAGPADNPISPGLPAGTITDDTEQAVVLGRLLVDGGGRVDPRSLADALLDWETRMAERGSLDLLGPTTRRALAAIRAGADPRTTGRGGSTNGAAMRITPVGIATPADPPDRLRAAVMDAGRPTHDSPDAHAAAGAVAAVVSLGVAGARFDRAWPDAVRIAEGFHREPLDHDVPALIREAIELARRTRHEAGTPAALDAIAERVGTSLASHESIPAGFAVAALAPDDAWTAAWFGARLGGDADTIAAIAGAMVGACTGYRSLPAGPVATVRAVNRLDLDQLADRLLRLRERR